MRQIDFAGTPGKRRAAFVILYARDAVPMCLMLNRSDGQIGFAGGMVEPGEALEDAVRREVREEIGYDLCAPMRPLTAHDIGPITTHAFVAELLHAELRAILVAAPAAIHFGREITGVFLPHLMDYGAAGRTCAGLGNLLRSALASSVREELVHFLLATGLFTEPALADVCQRAGFSLAALIA